ncbi:transposase [Micromonospora sp. WMMA1949]|nr:transposase [Micromonospora sp. WMMA1949]MCZ7424177.1 transposase [Micromonospora sp. WMMA1949]
MGERAAYPSDLTDEQWAVVGPFLQAWKDRHPSVSGHQGRYELREIVNAIFYQPDRLSVGVPAARPAAKVGHLLLLRSVA